MWWTHKPTGNRQFAVEGSKVAERFARSKAWEPEEKAAKKQKPASALPPPEPLKHDPEDVINLGGGYYQLPNGAKVRGKAAAGIADDVPSTPAPTGGAGRDWPEDA